MLISSLFLAITSWTTEDTRSRKEKNNLRSIVNHAVLDNFIITCTCYILGSKLGYNRK